MPELPEVENTTRTLLEMAYQKLQAQNLPLAENVIILFTDGSPNGITADFPLRTKITSPDSLRGGE